jgi:excisionase family DNA binding protein
VTAAVLSPADASAKLLDVAAVAEMLGCSQRHIYRLADAGRMPPPVKLGSLVRWSSFSIREWIDQGCPSVRNVKGARR